MIEQIRLGMKMVRYAPGRRTMAAFTAFFFGLGILWFFLDGVTNRMGGLYLGTCGLYIVQLVMGISASSLVQASPRKKQMQTLIPVLVELPCCFAVSGVAFLLHLILIRWGKQTYEEAAGALMLMGLFQMLMMVYLGFAYKNFLLSIFLFFVAFGSLYPFIVSGGSLPQMMDWLGTIPLWGILGINAAQLLLGGLLQYLLSLAVYRLPLSKNAMGVFLRKYM